MLVHRRVTHSSKFTSTHLYTWVERGTVILKCIAYEHNAVHCPRLEPGSLDPESGELTIRPWYLPLVSYIYKTETPAYENIDFWIQPDRVLVYWALSEKSA